MTRRWTRVAAPLERAGASPPRAVLRAVLLFVNRQAKVLTGRDDPNRSPGLTAWYPHVAVKMAADGPCYTPTAGRVAGAARRRWTGGRRTGAGRVHRRLPAPWLDKTRGEARPAAAGWRHTRSLIGARPVCEVKHPSWRSSSRWTAASRGHRRVWDRRGDAAALARPGPGSSWHRIRSGWRSRRRGCALRAERRGSARTWPNGPGGRALPAAGAFGRRTSWSTARGSTCGRAGVAHRRGWDATIGQPTAPSARQRFGRHGDRGWGADHHVTSQQAARAVRQQRG